MERTAGGGRGARRLLLALALAAGAAALAATLGADQQVALPVLVPLAHEQVAAAVAVPSHQGAAFVRLAPED